jgi:hypothetical protein
MVAACRSRPSLRMVQLMGRDMTTVSATMPMTVPSATSPRYATPREWDSIVVAASRAIPAEPARPWTSPMASGLVAALATGAATSAPA